MYRYPCKPLKMHQMYWMHNCETTDWKTIVSRVRHILLRKILAYCPILQNITRISRRTTITFPSFSSIVNLHLSKNFRIISEMESYESEIYVTCSVSVLFYYVYRQRFDSFGHYFSITAPKLKEKHQFTTHWYIITFFTNSLKQS